MSNPAHIIFDTWRDAAVLPIFSAEGGTLDRDSFRRLVYQRAADLRILPGEAILIASGREARFFIDMLAVWLSGGIAVPCDPAAGEEMRRHMLDSANARRILEDCYPLETSEYARFDPYPMPAGATCAFLFTSGSTGKPKAVELSADALLGNARSTLEILRMSGDRLLMNVPFHFTSAICHFLACSLSSSTLVGIERKLIFSDYVARVAALRPTAIGGAPVQFRWLAEALNEGSQDFLSELRFIMSSGDHFPSPVITALRTRAPDLSIFTVYGLTEVGGRFCILPPGQQTSHLGSVGKPIRGLSVKVLSVDGNEELDPNEEGEVVVTGDYLAKGYFGNPESTDKSFTSDGFRTGDIGYLDENGFLYLKGRADDVFKVNGAKVSGVLITQALMQTRLFVDAAVIAAEVQPYGTVPVACVVMKTGQPLEKGKVRKALRQMLPPNHMPHEFVVVEGIPRTGSGKVQKQALRARLDLRPES